MRDPSQHEDDGRSNQVIRLAAWLIAALGAVGQALAAPHFAYAASPQKGAVLFGTYCAACHGPLAAGCGPRATLYIPRPANLTASTRSAEYKAAIIRGGGASMGRSPYMPPWGEALSAHDITDLVAHLSTLKPRPTPPC